MFYLWLCFKNLFLNSICTFLFVSFPSGRIYRWCNACLPNRSSPPLAVGSAFPALPPLCRAWLLQLWGWTVLQPAGEPRCEAEHTKCCPELPQCWAPSHEGRGFSEVSHRAFPMTWILNGLNRLTALQSPCKPVSRSDCSLTVPGDHTLCSPPKFASQFRLASTPTQKLPDSLDRVFRHIRFFKNPTKCEYEGKKRWSSLLISKSLARMFLSLAP